MGLKRVNKWRVVLAAIILVIACIGIGAYAWSQSYSYRVGVLVTSVQPAKPRPWYFAWLSPPGPPANKVKVIESLVAMGPGAEVVIADQLQNESAKSRLCAAAALTELGTRQSLSALIEAVKVSRARVTATGQCSKVDDIAFEMMHLALGHIGDQRASDVLLGEQSNMGSGGWWGGSRSIALYLIGEPRAAVPYSWHWNMCAGCRAPTPEFNPTGRIVRFHGLAGVREALENPDANIASTACRLLADSADEQVVTFFLQQIKEGKPLRYWGKLPVSAEHCGDLLCRIALGESIDGCGIRRGKAVQLLKFIADDEQVAQTLLELAETPLKDHRHPCLRRDAVLSDTAEMPLKDRRHPCLRLDAGLFDMAEMPLKDRLGLTAAFILADTRPREGIPILRRLMLSEEEIKRSDEFLQMPPDSRERLDMELLVGGLCADSGWDIMECKEAIVASGDVRVVPLLMALMGEKQHDPYGGKQLTLLDVLWGLGKADHAQANKGAQVDARPTLDWDRIERQVMNELGDLLNRNPNNSSALCLLGRCPQALAVPKLLAALEKPAVDYWILEELARLRAPEAIPYCLRIARSAEYNAHRYSIVKYLARFKVPEAVPLYLKAINDKDSRLRTAAAWGLVNAGYKPARDKVVATLRKVNSWPRDEQQALELGRYLGADRTLNLLEDLASTAVQSYDRRSRFWPEWQEGMILAAAEEQRDRAITLVVKRVEALSKSKNNREDRKYLASAIRLLGRLRAKRAVKTILLAAGNWKGSKLLFRALADIGTSEAVAAIEAHAKTGNLIALNALARLRPSEAFELFMPHWNSYANADPNYLHEVMKQSGNLPAACDRVANTFAKALEPVPLWRRFMPEAQDPNKRDFYIKGLAWLEALDKAGDGRGAELLGKLLTDDPALRNHRIYFVSNKREIGLLSRMRHPAAGRVLRGLLKDQWRSVRCYAAEQLGKRRDREALGLLREMLSHPDAKCQYAAKQAIMRIDEPKP